MSIGNTGIVEAFEERAKKATAEKQLNEQAVASYEPIETGLAGLAEEVPAKVAAEKQLNEQASASYEPIETGLAEAWEILQPKRAAAVKQQNEQAEANSVTPEEQQPRPTARQSTRSGTSPPNPPTSLLGDTDASIEFLQERAATHPLWHPQLSFKRTDPRTGEEAKGFKTISFARDASGNIDWDAVRHWINDRQGKGNIYWTINAAKPMNKKPAKEDILAVVTLHSDLDAGDG